VRINRVGINGIKGDRQWLNRAMSNVMIGYISEWPGTQCLLQRTLEEVEAELEAELAVEWEVEVEGVASFPPLVLVLAS